MSKHKQHDIILCWLLQTTFIWFKTKLSHSLNPSRSSLFPHYPVHFSTYPACRAPGRGCGVSSHRSHGIQAGSGIQARWCGQLHERAPRRWICCMAKNWRVLGSQPRRVWRYRGDGLRRGLVPACRPCLQLSIQNITNTYTLRPNFILTIDITLVDGCVVSEILLILIK